MRKMALVALLTVFALAASAQRYPERKFVRAGNSLYDNGAYPMAGVMYMKALAKDSLSYEARFGMLDAVYKQGGYDAAAQGFAALAADTTDSRAPLGYFNAGNALFKQKKYQEAVEAYKNSLRRDPTDREAKFNLAYAKKMLEQQQKDNDQNKDRNKDQNKDRNKDQNRQPQPQDQNQDPQKPQPQQGQLSREEAQRMLDAVQMSEDKARQKLDSARKVPAGGGKNW